MHSLWTEYSSSCKSRLSALARSLFLSRNKAREKCAELQERVCELEEQVAEAKAISDQYARETEQLLKQNRELSDELANRPFAPAPVGSPPVRQNYGVGIIVLAINLGRKLGLRPAVDAMEVFFDWMGIEEKVPTYQSIRSWMQRVGLARNNNAEKYNGGTWLVDHTNQITKQKALMVVRTRKFEPGTPLRHQDLDVLCVRPGESWTQEDVAKVYKELVDQYGLPDTIVCDGAVELREPAKNLKKGKKQPLVHRDAKHFFANRFEAILTQDPLYQEFSKELGGTRSALGQTELVQFLPPGTKVKARFMNFGPTLKWAIAVLWHLRHPGSKSRKGITVKRFKEKLGWLSKYSRKLGQWQQCQDIIDHSLAFLNQQGIFKGCSRQLRRRLTGFAKCAQSRRLLNEIIAFLRSYEKQLKRHQRFPISTEVLESSFARYKAREKQHSKSGFTNLLLTFPVLLCPTTREEVNEALAQVRVADVKTWSETHCPNSLAAQRQLMFRETRTRQPRRKRATRETTAA